MDAGIAAIGADAVDVLVVEDEYLWGGLNEVGLLVLGEGKRHVNPNAFPLHSQTPLLLGEPL